MIPKIIATIISKGLSTSKIMMATKNMHKLLISYFPLKHLNKAQKSISIPNSNIPNNNKNIDCFKNNELLTAIFYC